MEIKEVIGIDASKLTLDCCIHNNGAQEIFDNAPEAIAAMVNWSLDTSGLDKEELLFVFEHTGLYTHRLIQYLGGNDYLFHVVPGLEIKRSMGIARGKDDKADAKRIALYGYRTREEIKPYQMPGESLARLKRFMSMRRKLVAQRAGHIATLGEQQRILDKEREPLLFEVQQQVIGGVTARFLIVYTVGFTAFGTWRKFASYCGIAPFPNRSGTSVRGRTKVNHLANKEGKTWLNLCASSAIQCNPEMRAYYKRRVEEGKNKMSTLNIIRNKLLARAFAVVNRGTPYVDTMKYAA